MISDKYHLKTHFFLFSLSVKISDYHLFLKNGCLIENKMHGASTQLRPVSHKCKLVGARVFPGRHVYGASLRGKKLHSFVAHETSVSLLGNKCYS